MTVEQTFAVWLLINSNWCIIGVEIEIEIYLSSSRKKDTGNGVHHHT
jgi:hypothetical protein